MPKKSLFAFLLSLCFLPFLLLGEQEQEIFAFDKEGNVGVNPISPGSGNLQREILDLTTFGNTPIKFKRLYRSRHRNYAAKAWEFGAANTWQHNWAWELRDTDFKELGFHNIRLNTPEGDTIDFKATDNTGMIRAPGLSRGDRLYQWKPPGEQYNGQTLVTPEGWEYYFTRSEHPRYNLIGVRDPDGQMWELEYDNQNRLIKIQNRFGRFISIERNEIDGLERIVKVKSSDGREVNYEYGVFKTNTVLKSVAYPSGEEANYTYVGSLSLNDGRPLLATADDPMVEDAGSRIRWVYNYQPQFGVGRLYMVEGMAKEERNLVTDELIVSIPLGAGSESWVVEGDGTGTHRKFFNGKLVEKVDGEGRWVKIFYSQGGHGYISRRLYPNGAEVNYERDAQGRITKQTDALGNSRSYTYNANGFLLTSTDEEGHTTTIERNVEDLPIKKTYPDGTSEGWTYNQSNQILTFTARNGGVTTYTYYNGELGGWYGDLKTVTDALGNITTFTHNNAGNILTRTDALNHTTSYSYNWRGKLLTVTYPDNSQIVKTYNSYGKLFKHQNELGFVANYIYDEYNRLETVTDPEGGIVIYQYGKAPDCGSCSAAQTISKIIDPEGRETHYFYDKSGNRIQQILGANTPDAAVTFYKYDAVSDLTEIIDPNGHKTIQTFDLNHKILTRTDSLGHTTSFTYNKLGSRKTETRNDGTIISYDYDSMNRLFKITDFEGNITQMTYDNNDNLEKLIDAKNNIYIYQYDFLNRKKVLIYPDNSTENWDYDKVGNLKVYTARNGATRTCTYDLRDRELTGDWSDNSLDSIKTYDSAGRLLTLNNSTSQLTYTYDKANRILNETQTLLNSPLTPQIINYTYDKSGLKKTLTYPDSFQLSYIYTARKQLKTISQNQKLLVSYSYDLAGNRLTKILTPSDVTQTATYEYDVANRLKTITRKSNQTTIDLLEYAYNQINNVTARKQKAIFSNLAEYQYDKTDQLKHVVYNEGKRIVDYQWDKVGNRIQVNDNWLAQPTTYQANNLNQYALINQQAPSYDANGNLSKQDQSNFTYDSDNKLFVAQKEDANLTINYDARRRPVSRMLNGETTYLIYDDWNLIAEYNKDQLKFRYIHGANVDELISRTVSTKEESIYYQQDSLGNVIHLTNIKGQIVESYTYDAFGGPTFFDHKGNQLSASAYNNRFLFTGREWIKELGLYDYRNRVYSPELGRFLQTDPIRFGLEVASLKRVILGTSKKITQSLIDSFPNFTFTKLEDINIYRYTKNNSINRVDPLGLFVPGDGFSPEDQESQEEDCPWGQHYGVDWDAANEAISQLNGGNYGNAAQVGVGGVGLLWGASKLPGAAGASWASAFIGAWPTFTSIGAIIGSIGCVDD
jgi:RHS repeat-associated protein